MAEQNIMTTIYEGLSIKPSPGDSASDLVSAIQSLYDEYKTAYRDEWDRLTANEKMYHGDHWSDTGSGSNEPQPVMPIIFSTVENIQADLMDEYPEAVITPESSNDEKIGKILTRVVAQNHEACDYLYEYNDLIHDLLVGGYMIQEVGWDPTLNYGFGGAYIRCVSNKNIMFDPLCANIQDGRAVFKIERLPTLSRDAAINAGVEIQTNAEVVSAKKQAVESAENDAAVKVENANTKVTQAEQRLAGIDDPDSVKKGKKIAQASRELSAAKAAASQTASEGQKKVDTATADYKSEAAKAKRKNAANQQLVDEYHASKYCSDIERDTVNAPVGGSAADPAANTNVDANTAQNGIDSIKNGVAQTANEKYNNNRGDINGAENGNQAQAGGNAGVSGQAVTEPDSRMAQTVSGMDGRADYRGIGSPVKNIIRQQGATPVDLRTASDPSSFYAAISEAKQNNPHGAFVTAHDVSEYGDIKMFLDDDNGVGVAVTKDGDIVSVFKNPNISKSRKAVSSILLTAIDNGGVKLDNYNGGLSQMYLNHGFIPVARTAFVDEYAPSDWNYERDGRPDIIFWMHNGNDVETVARNIGTQEMPDLKALPLMEYDEAAAYRDGLITKNASANSTLKDLGANTPTPAELRQSKVYTNTYDKWLTDAEKAADSVDNSVYAVSKESDSIAMAKERVRASIDKTGGIDEAIHDLAHGSWDAPDVDTAMLIGETLRAEAAETGDYTKLNDWKQEIQRHMTESGQAIQALAKWTRYRNEKAQTMSGLFQVHIFFCTPSWCRWWDSKSVIGIGLLALRAAQSGLTRFPGR